MRRILADHAEVAHIWAQYPDRQEEGKCGNMFFEGPSLFSYGHHFEIARFIDAETVFFNCHGYSSSTARHQCHTKRALKAGIEVFEVPNVRGQFSDDHAQNIEYLKAEVLRLKKKALAAHSRVSFFVGEARAAQTTLAKYYKRFGRKVGTAHMNEKTRKECRALIASVFSASELTIINRKIERASELERKAQEREEAVRQERIKNAGPLIEAWKEGAFVSIPSYDIPVMLRIKGDIVETSRGARVPLEAAKELFSHWKSWREDNNRIPGMFVGQRIGDFKVDDIQVNEITIGCHQIAYSEVERVLGPAASIAA
jgi:hypothetical protein